MPTKRVILLGCALLVAIWGTSRESAAAILELDKGLEWYAHRDLTSSQFSDYFPEYRRKGFVIIDVDAYPVNGELRYSMVWRKNTDGRDWHEYRDMTSDQYHAKWEELRAEGFRPLDVENYRLGTRSYWAGIWVENVEGVRWRSERGLTASEHASLFSSMYRRGYQMVDIEVNATANGLRYSSIWYENVDGQSWISLRDMTRKQYQANFDQYSTQGYRVVDFEAYQSNGRQLFAAIWEHLPGAAWQVRSDRSEQEYTNLWYQYADEGYRLIDFERYETADGPRYAGIWAENAARYRYSQKGRLDGVIRYYSLINNLPGISVVVIRDGDVLYRRGFGFADVSGGATANSRTVYNAASVSKVIGGTLAAKLEDEGQLRDGTTFDLDLTRATSDYVPGLPAHHMHTVDELLSHLSCMGHYDEIPNQIAHYSTATAAAESFWNVPLLSGCSLGNQWNYSTPAFTLVGAALEGATGAKLNDLLRDELFVPYGLRSMRAQYETASLPHTRLLAKPYSTQKSVHSKPKVIDFVNPPNAASNPNVESSYSDNSWKVLGGGIETSAYDLARFGWKVLDGEILSAAARESRLWTRVNSSFIHGLGWALVRDDASRRAAQWNGSWTGSRSFLRAYRDDDLVIAIMSNRTDHRSDLNSDVSDLADAIAGFVLAP